MPAIIRERVALSTISDIQRFPKVMGFEFGVVDLFAGPGGLAEGFSAVRGRRGRRSFRICLSVEQDEAAHATLLLRAFLRQFPEGFPDEYYEFLNRGTEEPAWPELYPSEWQAAQREALRLRLGSAGAARRLPPLIEDIRIRHADNTILIGGPPCQAYSLVGRARNRGVPGYVPEKDEKHFLYKEYLNVLRSLEPLAFVMENVKGLLSATVSGASVLQQIIGDLHDIRSGGGYELIPLTSPLNQPTLPSATFVGDVTQRLAARPADYVIKSEELGVPQARHRIILLGIRRDVLERVGDLRLPLLSPRKHESSCVEHVLGGMPRLRCGISPSDDSADAWANALRDAIRLLLKSDLPMAREKQQQFRELLRQRQDRTEHLSRRLKRSAAQPAGINARCPDPLRAWITDPRLEALPNHDARRHMPSDLARYLFAATYAKAFGLSPKAEHFPAVVAPDHENWGSGKFADRFRVQLWNKPAATVTSHIAKDGHYFIHPDPEQCRSLTVREAARLQTFPDNYLFKGNRTQQYTQVGNAVPPYLALQIATALFNVLETYSSVRSTRGRRRYA